MTDELTLEQWLVGHHETRDGLEYRLLSPPDQLLSDFVQAAQAEGVTVEVLESVNGFRVNDEVSIQPEARAPCISSGTIRLLLRKKSVAYAVFEEVILREHRDTPEVVRVRVNMNYLTHNL
jgi:hypothetical protein